MNAPTQLCFNEHREIVFREYRLPELLDDSVRIQTHFTGIRHAEDIQVLLRRFQSKPTPFPWIPTCWGVGEVVDVGKKVRKVSRGDIAFGPMFHGQAHMLPESRVHRLECMNKEFSVFVEPGVTALRAIHQSNLRYGDRIAILGMGCIGLMALQYAIVSGAREIVVFDTLDSRLQVAQRLGAHHTINIGSDSIHPHGLRSQVNEAFDCVVELSGNDEALKQSITLARTGGTLVTAGTGYSADAIQFVSNHCQALNVQLKPLPQDDRTSREEETVIHSIQTKRVIVWPILTDTFPYEQAPEAYSKIERYPEKHIKVLLQYG